MATSASFDCFFDLPGELREQILGYLLIRPTGVFIGSVPRLLQLNPDDDQEEDDESYGYNYQNDHDGSPEWPVNYFLVSQTFNREATAIFFRENSFHIYATGRKYVPSASEDALQHSAQSSTKPPYWHETGLAPAPGEALLNAPEWIRSRRRIRQVVLYIQRPRGHLEKDIFQPLLDMILAGGLKVLEVRICWYGTRREGVLASAPMQALYRALSDPDLDVARLRVSLRRHEPFWCDLHEGGRQGCGSVRGKSEGWGEEWIDVDVKEIICKHGNVEEQLRIFKVGD